MNRVVFFRSRVYSRQGCCCSRVVDVDVEGVEIIKADSPGPWCVRLKKKAKKK